MTQMVFRHGDTKKWKGIGYDFEIISADEVGEYLDAGWVAHPDELLKSSPEPEPEPEPEPDAPKKTRKKAATDEPND
ncbi:TPA: hypothetical protein ACWGTM_003413 [Yersinia enterocolitica]